MIDPDLSEEVPAVTQRTLRQFAGLSLVVFGGLACWHALMTYNRGLAVLLAVPAIFPGGIGLFYPETARPVYTVLVTLTMPVGRVVSLIVLASLFFGVITPLGFLFRVFGRDSLHVRLPDRSSHWLVKPAITEPRSYTRQS